MLELLFQSASVSLLLNTKVMHSLFIQLVQNRKFEAERTLAITSVYFLEAPKLSVVVLSISSV